MESGNPPPTGFPSRKFTVPKGEGIGDILLRHLKERYQVNCTSCFQKTIEELNDLPPEQVRSNPVPFSSMIWENAEIFSRYGRPWAVTMMRNHPRLSDEFYSRLIHEAVDEFETNLNKENSPKWYSDHGIEAKWKELFDQGISDPDYAYPTSWKFTTTADLINASIRMIRKIPPDVTAIAGVPRSGLIPASAIATHMHLPLYEASHQHGIRELGAGSRGGTFSSREGRLLIIDDTVYRGGAMSRIRNITGNEHLYAAIYVRPGKQSVVNLYSQLLPSPHLLEWNLFNNGVLNGHCANPVLAGGWGIDFDGVLCEDCPADGTDGDDSAYLDWMINAPPKQLPRLVEIPLIVTARLDKYRPQTLSWLKQHGIKFKRLVMHPAQTFSERNKVNIQRWKASILASTQHCGFIESHDYAAQKIHSYWGKPCISLESGKVFQ